MAATPVSSRPDRGSVPSRASWSPSCSGASCPRRHSAGTKTARQRPGVPGVSAALDPARLRLDQGGLAGSSAARPDRSSRWASPPCSSGSSSSWRAAAPIFQIVGLLLVDNGIALVAFLITAGVPFLIELGVTLDVLLGVVVLMVLAQRMRHRVRRHRPRRAPGAARLMLLRPHPHPPRSSAPWSSRAAGWRSWAARVAVGANAAVLALGICLVHRRRPPWRARRVARGVLRADALSAFMVMRHRSHRSARLRGSGSAPSPSELADGRCSQTARHALCRLGPGLRDHHAPRRPGGQPRGALGRDRGDHRGDHVPGRSPPNQGRPSKPRGSTS